MRAMNPRRARSANSPNEDDDSETQRAACPPLVTGALSAIYSGDPFARGMEEDVTAAGRALEIATVGLGQAGGNLAAEFARRGYRALAFNTAASDLSTLSASGLSLPEDKRVYIGVDGHDGAGSDVGYARQCVNTHAAKIRERVAEHAVGADIVLLTCGLGGGTGSAAAELVRALAELSLPMMVLATLPSGHESGIAKVNAVRAVNELVKENLLGWIFVDNARLAETHGSVSLDRYYAEVNKVVAEPLDAFNHLNERRGVVPIRTMDSEDLRALLLSNGVLNFGLKQMAKLTTETVIEAVRESVQFSTIMPQGFNLETVSSLGLVLEAPDAILASTPFSFFEQLSEQLKDETGGAAVHLGVYRDNDSEKATIRLVCASQALPEGVREMVTAARREGAQLRDKMQQTLTGLDLGDIEEYELLRTSPGILRRPRITEQPPSGTSRKPAFRPSAPPQAERSAQAAAAAASPPATQALPSIPSITSVQTASPTATPQTSITPPGASLAADRETYDQMVRDYKSASSEDIRKKVVDRLESDRRSENSLVRYYAVRAMTKLDPSLFEDALQAAAQDEDATVRAIAAKALQQRA
jgi:cell division GTPase FtsZ